MMKRVLMAAMALVLLGVPAAAATAQEMMSPTAVREDPALGSILTDAGGRTLYTFTRDEPGKSNCYEQCAVNWPPFLAATDSMMHDMEPIGVAERTDGSKQYTHMGMPLYYYNRDTGPGETNGQGVGGIWFVVTVDSMMMPSGM